MTLSDEFEKWKSYTIGVIDLGKTIMFREDGLSCIKIENFESLKKRIDEMEEFWNNWEEAINKNGWAINLKQNQRTQKDIENEKIVNSMRNPVCPKCKGILTPWENLNYVCDVCGYGKNSDEFELLQNHLRNQWWKLLESIRDKK